MIRVVTKYGEAPGDGTPAVFVGRGSPLDNPFRTAPVGPYGDDESIELYRKYLAAALKRKDPAIRSALNDVWTKAKNGGVRLTCFCGQARCHAFTIKELVEARL